jgi:predicted DNA-binding transcriptional regulator YafY
MDKTENPAYRPLSTITFTYKNWQGKIERRTVQPFKLAFGDMGAFHDHRYGWMLEAFCCDRGAQRTFELSNIRGRRPKFEIIERGIDGDLLAELTAALGKRN